MKAMEPVRILLSESDSQRLSAIGVECFAVVGRDTYPGNPAQWVIYLLPTTFKAANSATGVAKGTHRAVRIKSTPDHQPTTP
jgi:hypothetical protein